LALPEGLGLPKKSPAFPRKTARRFVSLGPLGISLPRLNFFAPPFDSRHSRSQGYPARIGQVKEIPDLAEPRALLALPLFSRPAVGCRKFFTPEPARFSRGFRLLCIAESSVPRFFAPPPSRTGIENREFRAGWPQGIAPLGPPGPELFAMWPHSMSCPRRSRPASWPWSRPRRADPVRLAHGRIRERGRS